MPFLVIPILIAWISLQVADAADGVVEPAEEPRDLYNPTIQAAPGHPYGVSNQ